MKKILLTLIAFSFALVIIIVIILNNNRSNQDIPINYLIESINSKDTDKLPNAFHEYCSLCIEQNISEKDFNEYIDSIIKDFGNDYKVTYKMVNSVKLSDDEINSYETNAVYTYSDYPYLSNGKELKFECIYKVTTKISIDGNVQKQNNNVDFLIVKINGKFYFLHTPNQLMSMFIKY